MSCMNLRQRGEWWPQGNTGRTSRAGRAAEREERPSCESDIAQLKFPRELVI